MATEGIDLPAAQVARVLCDRAAAGRALRAWALSSDWPAVDRPDLFPLLADRFSDIVEILVEVQGSEAPWDRWRRFCAAIPAMPGVRSHHDILDERYPGTGR